MTIAMAAYAGNEAEAAAQNREIDPFSQTPNV